MYRRWVVELSLISSMAMCHAHATAGSYKEMQAEVLEIQSLSKVAPYLNVEAYQRELNYEKQGLTLEERAESETNILTEKMRSQIALAYEAALDETGFAELAEAEVEAAIRKDLELAAPEFREELLSLSLIALHNAQRGFQTNHHSLKSIKKVQLANVAARSQLLNKVTASAMMPENKPSEHFEVSNFGGSNKTGKLIYGSKAELLNDLVSDAESVRWVSTSNTAYKTETVLEDAGRVNLQVKIDFLGVELEAGPRITFKKMYKTLASIFGEGLQPILREDGNLDFAKRDREGKIVYEAPGKPKRRFISFYCEVALQFESEYMGQGGFRIMGSGAEASVSKSYSNLASLTSRRLAVPEEVAGKAVSIKFLSNLCANEFIHAKINDRLKVSDSLDVTMKRMVSGLKFSHPLTNCAEDTHCADWFNNEVLSLLKFKAVPRCVEDGREKYRSCVLRGTTGQNCALFEKGKQIGRAHV